MPVTGVPAPHDEVIDDRADRAVQAVDDRHRAALGVQAPGGRARAALAPPALAHAQAPARAGVHALGGGALRSRGGVPDLRAGAPARVQQPEPAQALHRTAVMRQARRLEQRLTVPVEAERAQVRELRRRVLRPAALGVQILDAHEEPRAGGTGEQPGQ